MPNSTTYVCRWNATLNRKEARREGYPSFVLGGGTITPGNLVVGLTVSPTTPVAAGGAFTLTATISGGTGPYSSVFSQTSGATATLTGTGTTRNGTVPSGATADLEFKVRVTDSSNPALVQETLVTVDVSGAVATGAKFPGHVPNRVLLGMATPDGNFPGPGWTDALGIIGQPIYEARRFTGQWVNTNAFNAMIANAEEANALPWISFKPNGDNAYASATAAWQAVADGARNADLLALFNLAVGYGKPLLCSFHHEPSGDGTGNYLSVWAKMQTFCAYYFAGYRNVSWGGTGGNTLTKGAYNAAHDISLNNGGKFGWAPIGNGFWWRPATPQAAADEAYPAHLITALNACKGVCGNDFYDADYVDQTRAFTEQQFRVAGTGVRTWKRIDNFMTWARAKGVNAAGAGEYGCIDAAEMDRSWAVQRENRDIWAIGNYFNSAANSDHEWRLIPANWPDTTYESDKLNSLGQKFQDLGGTQQRADCLARFKVHLTESTSAAYTGPVI